MENLQHAFNIGFLSRHRRTFSTDQLTTTLYKRSPNEWGSRSGKAVQRREYDFRIAPAASGCLINCALPVQNGPFVNRLAMKLPVLFINYVLDFCTWSHVNCTLLNISEHQRTRAEGQSGGFRIRPGKHQRAAE